MKPQKQNFPALSISLLENGLLRFEDETFHESCVIDAHPTQVQLACAMIGRPVPDGTRAQLLKLHGRIAALHTSMESLGRMLADALTAGECVGVELNSAEHITERLADLVQDLAEMAEGPEIEQPVAEVGPGGQMTLAQI